MAFAALAVLAAFGASVHTSAAASLSASHGQTRVFNSATTLGNSVLEEFDGSRSGVANSRRMLNTLGAWLGAHEAPPPPEIICGELLPHVDFKDENVAPAVQAASADACIRECAATPGCNAMSWVTSSGTCYRKGIPEGFVASERYALTSYKMCPEPVVEAVPEEMPPPVLPPPEEQIAIPPPPPLAPEIYCGDFIVDVDFKDMNIAPLATAESAQGCLDICTSTPDCNSMTYNAGNKYCFLKKIPEDFVPNYRAGLTSYLLCPSAPIVKTADPAAADDDPLDTNDPRSNPHPDQSPLAWSLPVENTDSPPRTAADIRPLIQGAHAWFDYQIAGAYNPTLGTKVVVRDWFTGSILFNEGAYSICYVNAFQTKADCDECVDRPDYTKNWPADVVLAEFEDPKKAGQHAVDISTPEGRDAAAKYVYEMTKVCEDKYFDAVVFDNLDSFVKFPGAPFTVQDTIEYAKILVDDAHKIGLAVAQMGAIELIDIGAHSKIGFDFALAQSCGQYNECAEYHKAYNGAMLSVEYTEEGFANACRAIGYDCAVVLRDEGVSMPESANYMKKQCGPD